MATYRPLQSNETPIQGTSGAAVLELQKKLNEQGANLKTDALYGPLTAAAFKQYGSKLNPKVDTAGNPIITTQTDKTAFVEPTLASYETDPNYKYAQDINTKLMKGEDIVDTNAIRSQTLAGFQDRINSLNSIYAQKMAEAKQQGVGRVGQTTAILANRGLAGSARGGAIAEGTLQQNASIENAIANEQAVALQELYGKASQMAVEEAARKRAAIEGGAKAYIEFVKNQEITKKDNLGNLAGAFIAQGIDPSTMTPDEIKALADKLKVSPADIISTYKQKQYEKQQADIKANPNKELSQGEALYVFNPATGKYEQQGYNPKTSVKTGTGGSATGDNTMLYAGLPSSTATAVRSQVTAFKTEPLVTNFNTIQDGYNFASSISGKTTNPADDQALIYSLAKVLDPNSVVREGEYATAAKYSQSWLKAFGKSVSQAIAGTGFLSEEARKNIKNTIATRYAASKKSYDNVYNQYVGGINNLTGRDNGALFLKNYSTSGNTSDSNTVNDADPLGLGI